MPKLAVAGPISLNGPMAVATFNKRKTQTRRPVKPQPKSHMNYIPGFILEKDRPFAWSALTIEQTKKHCAGEWLALKPPLGLPGTLRYVREPASVAAHTHKEVNGVYGSAIKAQYSDGTISDWIHRPSRLAPVAVGKGMPNGCFREASRMIVEIVNVRVERVQEISMDEAAAEGVYGSLVWRRFAIDKFHDLWNSIYNNWEDSPWVWVYEYKIVKKGGSIWDSYCLPQR